MLKGATVIAADIDLDSLNETVKISINIDRLYIYVIDISDNELVISLFIKRAESSYIPTDIKKNSNILYNVSSESKKSNCF